MTDVLLATAFTPDYERGPRYVETLKKHCNVPFQIMRIGQDLPDYGMPRAILQAGHFIDHLDPCQIVIFTDADILMHRPMDAEELRFIDSIGSGEISACPNKHLGQLWAEEVPLLSPTIELYGYDDVKVFNTGFVVAQTDTYRELFKQFQRLWPTFDSAFQHYAKIQLAMCAAARDLGIEWVPTPGHLCSHGHHGIPAGVALNSGKSPTFNGRVICFDHRLTH